MKVSMLFVSAVRVVGSWFMASVAVLAVLPAHAQPAVWRCGNEYTNQPGPNPAARGCRPVEGGNLSIVEDTRRRDAPSATPADNPNAPAATPPRAASAPAPANASAGASAARSPNERVDRSDQQARDRDARLILEAELRRAQERVQELAREFNQGRPSLLPGEQATEPRYLERTEDLRRRLERAQGDVAAIEREMARLPVPR